MYCLVTSNADNDADNDADNAELNKNKALLWLTGAFPRPGGPSEPTYIGVALPFLSFLFYSLLILLYLFISQTRPNQQHLNTTNANPGG